MSPTDAMPRVAANLTFIEPRALTGPGHYAVQVFEELTALAETDALDFSLSGYVQDEARHHFSERANTRLAGVGALGGRAGRVAFEQVRLPFRSRQDGVSLLWSPAFVSPLWGAPKLVATIHDMYYEVVPEVVEPRQRRYWRTMIPLTARVCDALITVSENSRADMLAHLPTSADRVFVTPLASRMHVADFAAGAPPIPGDYVLMVANTTPNKNCERVTAAMAALRDQGRAIRLVHIGNDVDGRLRAAADAAQLGDLLVSMGKVSEAVLANAYRHCLATIVASTYEGFGMPAAEAQAMGAPLICSDRSAVPEAAGGLDGGGALFVDPLDTAAIAAAIARVADDPALAATLSARGLAQARTLSWRRTAEQTAAAFSAVLADGRR
ncbi:glycosyltransferase family 4 protein [Sphingomonas sp.]|jgi:glycosyltransferase involved in cell wall biosynthesis|uniref:glycosyltransferase family 4 protein n=1 Tax=Sphingomonas sp. TaxID=28214 RepID=UPI0035C7FB9F